MHRIFRRVATASGAVAGGLFLFVLLFWLSANTAPGRLGIAWLAPLATGGEVRIAGLSGDIPSAPRADNVWIADEDGTWLKLERVSLRWHPAGVFHNHLQVASLDIAHAIFSRLPKTKSPSKQNSKWRYEVGRIAIGRLDIIAPLAAQKTAVTITGRGHYRATDDLDVDLDVHEIGGPAVLRVHGASSARAIDGRVSARDAPKGPIARIFDLPFLGPIFLEAAIAGPRSALRTTLDFQAGALKAQARGNVDLERRLLSLVTTASSPPMSPRRDLSWQAFTSQAKISGSFTKPVATGSLVLSGLKAGLSSIARLSTNFSGRSGKFDLAATINGVNLPGPAANLFSGRPINLAVDANLDRAAVPVRFVLSHKLAVVTGGFVASDFSRASLHAIIPDLAPFSALAGRPLAGQADLSGQYLADNSTANISLQGTVRHVRGDAIVSLLGDRTAFNLAVKTEGDETQIEQATIRGDTIEADVTGSMTGDDADFRGTLSIANLSKITRTIAGRARARFQLSGKRPELDVAAAIDAIAGTRGGAQAPVRAELHLHQFPVRPAGELIVSGSFDRAPVDLSAAISNDKGQTEIDIRRARWKSLAVQGRLALARSPAGQFVVHAGSLGDLDSFAGQSLKGRIDGKIAFISLHGHPMAQIAANGSGLRANGTAIGRVAVGGAIADPLGRPGLALRLALSDIRTADVSADAQLALSGSPSAVAYRATAAMRAGKFGNGHLSGSGLFDPGKHLVSIDKFSGDYGGIPVRLRAPVHVDYAGGVSVDALRANVAKATVDLKGRILPHLDLALKAANVTDDLARPFAPDLRVDGTVAIEARLKGSLDAPDGTIAVHGDGIRWRNAIVAALPPAHVAATASVAHGTANVHGRIDAGAASHVAFNGAVPTKAGGRVAVHASGTLNLAAATAVLAATGRSVRGSLAFDGDAAGTFVQPRFTGHAKLTNGEIEDYVQGIHVSAVSASITAIGNKLTLSQLSAKSGTGTITGSGTVDLATKSMPIAINLAAHHARPVGSDLFSAEVDANLKLAGPLAKPGLTGNVNILRGEINLPDSMPTSVAVLDVRRKGQKWLPRAPSTGIVIPLGISVAAGGGLFVRGHGIDAEMGGDLKLAGSNQQPFVSGGFTLRRGTLDVAGQTLKFTSGKITFDGRGLRSSLDPALDFIAQSESGGITSTLKVGGYASAPKFTLTSVPSLPQDEILARMFFGQSAKQLSPLQLAEIAGGLASLGGGGGSGMLGNPLASIRKNLGLDRFAVSGGDNTAAASATVEAGRYVAKGIYVGGKQNTAGGTQAQVQFDITKHLKAQATLSAGTPANATPSTPLNDKGSSVGLTYEFEY